MSAKKSPFAKLVVGEIEVVTRRRAWLEAVVHSDQHALEGLKSGAQTEPLAQMPKPGTTSSRDLGSIISSGPCAGYQQLELFQAYENHKAKLKHCCTEAEIKTTLAEKDDCKKLFTTLSMACKAAVSDLRSALKAKENEKERQDKEDSEKGKAGQKRKGKEALSALGVAAAGKRAKATEPSKLIDAVWSLCAEVPSGRFGSMKVSVETPWVVTSSRVAEKLSAAPTKKWEHRREAQDGAAVVGVAGLVNNPKDVGADNIPVAHEASLGEGHPEPQVPADGAQDQEISDVSKDNMEKTAVLSVAAVAPGPVEPQVEAASEWSWSQALDEFCQKWLLHPLRFTDGRCQKLLRPERTTDITPAKKFCLEMVLLAARVAQHYISRSSIC